MNMYIHTQIFTAALFVKQKKKKKLTQRTNNGRMDKQTWRIHTVEYYLAIKRKKVLIRAVTWLKVENIMLSKRSQIQKVTYCMIPFT